jgi:hypothetical protein
MGIAILAMGNCGIGNGARFSRFYKAGDYGGMSADARRPGDASIRGANGEFS